MKTNGPPRDIMLQTLVKKAQKKGLLPSLPGNAHLPLPRIHNVELYLSFHGNDRCAHCLTYSGPERKEVMTPGTASALVRTISRYSIIAALAQLMGGGNICVDPSEKQQELDVLPHPPHILSEPIATAYADCMMGKEVRSFWDTGTETFALNFGRPSIRISGGEFYTWPHRLKSKNPAEDERLKLQQQLLEEIRTCLPEYDIWILTNGRFAENDKKTEKVIRAWVPKTETNGGGKTRLAVSVDPFHRPPKGSTVENMLECLWNTCRNNRLGAPYIYSLAKKKVFLLGRALENFQLGTFSRENINNVSASSLNEFPYLVTDPVYLEETDGCNELKGFLIPTPKGTVLGHNIFVNYTGDLMYCCVCVGNYGNFLSHPEQTLKKLSMDPVSVLLRKKKTAVEFLNMAAEMDKSIKVFGKDKRTIAAGATCYQLLSGKRVGKQNPENLNQCGLTA